MNLDTFFKLNPHISLSYVKSLGALSVSCKIQTSDGRVMSQNFQFDYYDFLNCYYNNSMDDVSRILRRRFRPFEEWCFKFYSITPYYLNRAVHQNKKLKRSLQIPPKLAKIQKELGVYKKPIKNIKTGEGEGNVIDFAFASDMMLEIVRHSAEISSFECYDDYKQLFMKNFKLYSLSKKQDDLLFNQFKKYVNLYKEKNS